MHVLSVKFVFWVYMCVVYNDFDTVFRNIGLTIIKLSSVSLLSCHQVIVLMLMSL